MARILIHDMGDKSVFDKLNAIAKKNGASDEEMQALKHLTACYDVCRINRNEVVHAALSMGATLDDSRLRMIRAKGTAPGPVEHNDTLQNFRTVFEETATMRTYMIDLTMYFCDKKEGRQPSLPERPPLPQKFWIPPGPPDQPKRQRQQRPSRP